MHLFISPVLYSNSPMQYRHSHAIRQQVTVQRHMQPLTWGPAGPKSPLGPCIPWGPGCPLNLVSPGLPNSPFTPLDPKRPGIPGRPISPFSPCISTWQETVPSRVEYNVYQIAAVLIIGRMQLVFTTSLVQGHRTICCVSHNLHDLTFAGSDNCFDLQTFPKIQTQKI